VENTEEGFCAGFVVALDGSVEPDISIVGFMVDKIIATTTYRGNNALREWLLDTSNRCKTPQGV
jgi:hypothetical protein